MSRKVHCIRSESVSVQLAGRKTVIIMFAQPNGKRGAAATVSTMIAAALSVLQSRDCSVGHAGFLPILSIFLAIPNAGEACVDQFFYDFGERLALLIRAVDNNFLLLIVFHGRFDTIQKIGLVLRGVDRALDFCFFEMFRQ